MTFGPTRRWDAGRWGAVCTLLLLAFVTAGCGGSSPVAGVNQRLTSAGFTDVSTSLVPDVENVGDGVSVTAGAPAGMSADAGYDAVARTVWTTLPVRFDALQVQLDGQGATIDRDGLTRLLGPRDPALDRQSMSDALSSASTGLIIGVVIAAVVALAVLVGLTVLIVRARRRRAEKFLAAQQYRPPPGPVPPGYPPPHPGYQEPPAGL